MKSLKLRLLGAFGISLVLVLMVGGGVAFGQAITQYTGSIQVQNLENALATFQLTFYPQSGLEQSFTYTMTANGGKKLFPLDVTGAFNGSAVISSDRQVYAVSTIAGNTASTQLYYNGVYESFSQGADRLNFPLMQANNSANFSWFNIQNTGSSPTTVNIQFLPRDSNMGSHYISGVSIDPNRAKTFKLADYAAQLYGTANRFVGSVVVTTTGTVAGVAVQENTTTYVGMGSYDAFLGSAGSTTIVAPLLQFYNAGGTIFSSVNVQNVGATTTTITATYTAPTCPGCSFTPSPEVKQAGPGKIATFNLLVGSGPNWVGDSAHRWVGGASFVSSGQTLVGIATILQTSPKSLSMYGTFDPANATNKAVIPMLQFDNGQTYSSATVYNLGPDQINVTLTYGPNTCSGCTFAPVPESADVLAGSAYNFRLLEGATTQWTSTSAQQKRWIGSGTVTLNSGTGPFVVVVNQVRLGTWGRSVPAGDTMVTYDALNVTP